MEWGEVIANINERTPAKAPSTQHWIVLEVSELRSRLRAAVDLHPSSGSGPVHDVGAQPGPTILIPAAANRKHRRTRGRLPICPGDLLEPAHHRGRQMPEMLSGLL
jgi:hypothetical protein